MKKIIIAVAVIAFMASCSESEKEITPPVDDGLIRFNSEVNITKATTGLIDLAALKASADGFAVSTSGLGSGLEMNNVAVKFSSGSWGYTGKYYWPTTDVTFTAYAPAGTANVTLASSGLTATDFVPATTVGSQIDLIYAAPATFNKTGAGSTGVALTFNHLLTQVVFSATTDITSGSPTITSIVLTVPQNKGSYNGTAWTAATTSQTYTLFSNNALSATAVTSTPLLLIPQTIPSGTTAAITFVVNGSSNSTTVDLSSLSVVKKWDPGVKVTYNLAINSGTLTIKFTDPVISPWTTASDNITY